MPWPARLLEGHDLLRIPVRALTMIQPHHNQGHACPRAPRDHEKIILLLMLLTMAMTRAAGKGEEWEAECKL